ncbi:Oidioi.mRNA.OKI2018_I69.chr2.g4381.t1.cds [Oikopleura dioica]|uniref:Oidioi.mRNA.OKI2018_I69.chr2.g4381.t1.cds n=1 Tax=Oikopleura dioica TaxID=34765 RepID=A0ABN7T2Q5_OIKDI|nr:Oidioi.mRNA.OKI2018_I69.chr2.g4381.t1.cds [Oikopleura dioica]
MKLNGYFTIVSYNSLLSTIEIDKFLGMKKTVPEWSYESVYRSSTYRSKKDRYGNVIEGSFFLAALPDNEGVLLLTSNFDILSSVDRITINRIYKNNWFYVVVFKIPKIRNRLVDISFLDTAFILQGKIFVDRKIETCFGKFYGQRCERVLVTGSEIFLLDYERKTHMKQEFQIDLPENYAYEMTV